MPELGSTVAIPHTIADPRRPTSNLGTFHEQLAQLTSLLNARHAFLTKIEDADTLRTIASWQEGGRGPERRYCARGTPCADTLRHGSRLIEHDLDEHYPDDMFGRQHGFTCYVGCRITNELGHTVGHLGVYGSRPFERTISAVALVSLFAGTIGAEMQHRRATLQFEQQRETLQTLLANLPGMAYRCKNNRSWTMKYVSAGCRELTGFEPSNLEQQPAWDRFIHPDDGDYVWNTVQDALAEGCPFALEYRILTKSGQTKWVSERGREVERDVDGSRLIEGLIIDITALKDTEAELARAKEALRKRSERLDATLQHAPVGIATYRMNQPFVSANRAFCRLTGYSAAELMNMTEDDVTHPDDRRLTHVFADRAHAQQLDSFTNRRRYVRRDGTVIDVKVISAITHDAAGRPDLVIAQVENLTPRLKAEAEARRNRALLAHTERLNTLGEMATGIAHEINQPLAAISLFAQAGKRLVAAGRHDDALEVFDKLSQHARRAGAIIARVQTMSRQEESVRQIIDCNALIAEIVQLAESEARIRDIEIEGDFGINVPKIRVDSVQIQQVVLNLLRNGMEAMHADNCRAGRTIRINSRRCSDGNVEIAVIDSGTGVSESAADNLFAAFSTTKKSGMGIGLSISRTIIEAHGGQLSFRNNESGGATFFFRLPAHRDSGQDE